MAAVSSQGALVGAGPSSGRGSRAELRGGVRLAGMRSTKRTLRDGLRYDSDAVRREPIHRRPRRHRKRLRLTETATEVVETDPATFSFRVVRASVTTTTTASVRGFAGRAPTTEFVNGTPEHSTASTEEYFQVDPPHFDTADGTPHLSSRIDGGQWKTVSSTHRFYTGTLDVGPHHVTVRTSNAAGMTTTSFGWRVVPMPAPEPCVAPPSGACWYPPHLDSTGHPMRWDWQIGRVTPLERTGARAVDIYDIDGFLTTAAQVEQIHTSWQAGDPAPPEGRLLPGSRVGGLPAGRNPAQTAERSRPTRSATSTTAIRRSGGSTSASSTRSSRCSTRGSAMCAQKGFDAVELDDIDSFEPASTSGFNLTPGDAQNLLAWPTTRSISHGMTVLWKNTGILSWWGRDYSDGAVVEECYVYSECFSSQVAGGIERRHHLYRPHRPDARADGTTSPPTSPRTSRPGNGSGRPSTARITSCATPGRLCPHARLTPPTATPSMLRAYGFAAVKFDVNLDGKTFFPCPNGA